MVEVAQLCLVKFNFPLRYWENCVIPFPQLKGYKDNVDKDRPLKIIRILYLSKSTVTLHSYNLITCKSSRVRYKYVCLKM